MKKEAIHLEFKAEPLKLTMSERKQFKLSVAATNGGSEVVDPELHRARLFVNGKESKAWSLAVGNGKREAKWSALPPGETVSMTWSSMGESILTGPGTFTLVLRLDETELAPVRVRVQAE